MIQEETIKQLEILYDYCENMRSGDNDFAVWERDCEAIKIALSALRPITREQVDKVWRGCEKCNGDGEYSRYAENLTKTLLAKYCPHCGRPLTDEAVETIMKRMEEMRNG